MLTGPGYSVGIDGFAGLYVFGTNGGTNRKFVGTPAFFLGIAGTWV